jgi:NADPH-dependent F420 reductase
MNVLVIGTGNMGAAFVRKLAFAGHSVSVTSRSNDKAVALAAQHPGVRAVPAADAARSADIVIVATGYADAANALKSVGDLHGKVVIDITNPLTADYSGLSIGHDTSAAEEIARAVPKATVVKAFNTLFAPVLANGGKLGSTTVTVFYAGDDASAKDKVRALAESLGFDTIDAGNLKNARYLEPLAGLNIYLGYGAGLGTAIAPTWARG